MKIAVEGCCHGELDKIYQTIEHIQKEQKCKVDLLIICGDFQSVRDQADLQSMAVPPKYREMGTFYKYYSGEKKAPVLTLFIGGNHEATSYLSELPYGGWAAPNIYYMGFADVVQFNGLRIAGLSGIWKGHDYNRGHFEAPPYSNDTMRSAYHVRNLEVFRMKQISKPIDIVVTHDWPRGIYYHGNYEALIRYKPFFQSEIEENTLGNPVFEDLLLEMRPSYWFSAHLHVKFAAIVEHESAAVKNRLSVLGKTTPTTSKGYGKTKFLALDKCLPRRQFLQVLDVPTPSTFNATGENLNRLCLDPEWLCILKSTDHLLNLTPSTSYMPSKKGSDEERFDFAPSDRDIEEIFEEFGGDLKIPENFEPTVEAFDPQLSAYGNKNAAPKFCVNPQTTLICAMLGIRDITAEIIKLKGGGADAVSAPEALLKKTLENIDESKVETQDGESDEDSDTEEQRLLFEALQSRRVKESKSDEATEFPTFIANDDDEVDDDELKETLGMNRDDALKSLDFSGAEPSEEYLNPVHDLSPIKKNPDSTSTFPPQLTMKSVDEVIDEGLKSDSKTVSTSDAPAAEATTSSSTDAAASSVADASKRASEDESEVQKPKKQFKRRNVALYSTLATEDS